MVAHLGLRVREASLFGLKALGLGVVLGRALRLLKSEACSRRFQGFLG